MDAPHCDIMVHCLIARLLMLENFNQAPSTTVNVWSFEHERHNRMSQAWVALKIIYLFTGDCAVLVGMAAVSPLKSKNLLSHGGRVGLGSLGGGLAFCAEW